jgi:hypothetical protein
MISRVIIAPCWGLTLLISLPRGYKAQGKRIICAGAVKVSQWPSGVASVDIPPGQDREVQHVDHAVGF